MRGLLKKLAKVGVIIGLVFGCGWVLLGSAYTSCQLRYRLTVTIDDAGARRIGSGIVESILTKNTLFVSDSGPSAWSFRGSAIMVDLAEKGPLFIINRVSKTRSTARSKGRDQVLSSFLARLPEDLFDYEHRASVHSSDGSDALQSYCRAIVQYEGGNENQVPLAMLPMFVRFRDLNRRESLEEVNPEDLGQFYNQSVSLKSVTLRIVNEPISPTPNDWPSWLTNTLALRDWQAREWGTEIGDFYISNFKGE